MNLRENGVVCVAVTDLSGMTSCGAWRAGEKINKLVFSDLLALLYIVDVFVTSRN